MLLSAVFAITSAMVGAGFASGREIVVFFSRYGPFSWLLVLLAAIIIGILLRALLSIRLKPQEAPSGKTICSVEWFPMLLMFAVAGGAMTAAAGELAALMLPVFHGRAMGQILTLGAGIAISRKSVRALGMIGKILIPLMLLAFFFCFRASTESNHDTCVSAPPFGIALFQLLGYCGLNVTLSAGVIHEAGLLCKDDRKLTVYSSIALGVLLIAGNAAMLPHASWLENVPLPIVMLLRKYGKAGFYLSAFVLYLAVFSTFVAILRAMRGLFPENIRLSGAWIGLLCAAFSLFGFERLVQYAYSALGWIGVLLILWKKFRKNGTKRKSVSSIGRTLMKEEITE